MAGIVRYQVPERMSQGSGAILGLDDHVNGLAIFDAPLTQYVMVFEKAAHENQDQLVHLAFEVSRQLLLELPH